MPRPPPLLANASRSILAVVLVVCISMLEHHEASFLYRATYCACSLFTFVFFLKETEKTNTWTQKNKQIKRNTSSLLLMMMMMMHASSSTSSRASSLFVSSTRTTALRNSARRPPKYHHHHSKKKKKNLSLIHI